MTVLQTERLLLRDHELADLEPFCAMEADPDVRRFVGGAPRPREAAEQKFRSVYLPAVPPDRLALWATVFRPEGTYIGYCGVYPHFGEDGPILGEGTLALYLARAYWGRGIATEAGRAFIEFGFSELRLRRIVATVQVGNDASVRVLQKLGFSWERFEQGERRSYNHYSLESSLRIP